MRIHRLFYPGGENMDMFKTDETLMISVTNLTEFNALLQKAEKEAEQLRQTLAKLSRFNLAIKFSVEGDYAGDIEAASSAMSTILHRR